MSEFTPDQFRPDLEEILGPELLILVEALSTDPTAFIPTLQALVHRKLIELQEEVRIKIEQKIDELKQKILEKLPTKEELIELLTSLACSVAAQKAMERLYNEIKGIIAFAKGLISPVIDALNVLINKGNDIKNLIITIGENLVKISTIIAIIASIIILLRGILFALALIPPPFVIPFGILIPIYDVVNKLGDIIDPFVGILVDSIPEVLAAFGNLVVQLMAKVSDFIALILGVLATVEAIERALEALYLKYIALCNTIPSNGDLEGIRDQDITLYSNNQLDSFYDRTLDELRASGNDEVIEKIYDANFQQIGYKRYKI